MVPPDHLADSDSMASTAVQPPPPPPPPQEQEPGTDQDQTGRRISNTLQFPCAIGDGFEVSVHECPNILLREIKHVFPSRLGNVKIKRNMDPKHRILAVVTCQHALMDLARSTPESAHEKDRLLETFLQWAQRISNTLIAQNHWADFIDPCSGLPMISLQSSKVYSEVDGVEVLLRYRCLNAGLCKILLHPQWGAAVYPASLFTDAPYEVVKQVLESTPLAILQTPAETTATSRNDQKAGEQEAAPSTEQPSKQFGTTSSSPPCSVNTSS